MATAPDRPVLRARFEQRRDDVVAKACELFATRGYDGTSMEDVSEATGLAVGGLYHYIGSKQSLLSQVLRQLMDPLLERAVEIEAGPGPAAERLRELIRLWVRHVADHRHHMLVFNQERHALESDPARWREVRRSRRKFEGIVEALIVEMHGGERSDRDAQVTKMALLGMVNYTAQWLRPGGALDPDEIADGYWRLVAAEERGR